MILALEILLALISVAGAAFVAGIAYLQGRQAPMRSGRLTAIVIAQPEPRLLKESVMPDIVMDDTEQVPVPAFEADAAGFPVGGSVSPTWTIDDVGIATVGVAADGRTPAIVSVKPGSTAAHASLDLGAGAKTLDFVVTVNPGPAVSFGVTPGAPEPRAGF